MGIIVGVFIIVSYLITFGLCRAASKENMFYGIK